MLCVSLCENVSMCVYILHHLLIYVSMCVHSPVSLGTRSRRADGDGDGDGGEYCCDEFLMSPLLLF